MTDRKVLKARAFVACAIVALLCTACEKAADAKAPKAGELKRREPVRVRVAAVEQREMRRVLQTTTVVHSEKEIQLYPRASGIVTEVFVEQGDAVTVGQELAAVDDREARAMVADARVAVAEAKDAIARGDVAMREADARVTQTKIESEQAQRDYDRNEKASLISQQALDALRTARDARANEHSTAKLGHDRSVIEARSAATALERAQLSLARAELELSYTRIQAPIAGIVAQANVRIGGTVGRGNSVLETAGAAFVITDLSDLHVTIHRPQRELPWFVAASGLGAGHTRVEAVEDGSAPPSVQIRATAEALPGLELRGRIQRIAPSIDPQSGSFAVHAVLEPIAPANGHTNGSNLHAQDKSRLLPGMLVRLEIVTDRHPDALVVPKRSLRREGEANLLFIVREGRAHRIEVTEGFTDDAAVEVFAASATPLAPGDLVVVVGNRDLEDGAEVVLEETAKEATTTPAEPATDTATKEG